jgi:hypothetical protein
MHGFESRRGHGRLAQLGERLVYTQEVGSSILSPPIDFSFMSRAVSADTRHVEAAEHGRQPLGELLVAKGLVSKEELDLALVEQDESGRLLGAILVERGYVSGPALAVALAEQYGVELKTERGFGTGLWAEIDRRHRAGRGHTDEDEGGDNVVQLGPAKLAALEAVPEPDPQLDRLKSENFRLQDEIERLRGEFTKLKLVEAPEAPSSHLLFVPTPARYLLVEREGAPPEAGDELELPEVGGRLVVAKLGRAPFPGESRPCAFLLLA